MASLLVPVALFAASLVVLLAASNRFTTAAERLSLAAGVSPFLVGATVVAGGTSLPELVSSVLAARGGASEIVVGTVVGSNVANIFLVLGISGVAANSLRVERELVRVDLPLLVASAVFLLVATWDGVFEWYEGVLALAALAVYVHFTLSSRTRLDDVVEELVEEHTEVDVDVDPAVAPESLPEPDVGVRTYATLLASIAVVFVSADLLVRTILDLAGALDVGTELVALTAVAVGTSLPEIAVSVSAARRGTGEIAVGNVLGSNIFNSFFVVGVPSLVGPIIVPGDVRAFALPVMVLATALYYFVTQDREITQWEGATLLVLYATFVLALV